MKDVFKSTQIADKVHWVGAIDWPVRDFHGYRTTRGSTYNAYLILAEKVTLIDTVKAPFVDELLARIASVIQPDRIDYIICNHAEPDHAGSLAKVIEAVKPQAVFASKMGARALQQLYRLDCVQAVADGQEIPLGDMRLTCAETRMCHWPDSMVTYLHDRQLLFSQDIFGMHLAGYERFADQVAPRVLDEEAAKYYANILLPLSGFVAKALDKLSAMDVPLSIIAPDHGPIWRDEPRREAPNRGKSRSEHRIVASYARWARQERTDKAVVVYDTMWKSTDLMARAVGEGLAAGGARARLLPMSGSHRSDVATEILDAGGLIVGSPTINGQMFPSLADVLSYLTGLGPKGLVGGVFGSSGWSKEATKQLQAAMEQMEVELVGPPVNATYLPTDKDLGDCYKLGLDVAARIAR